MTEEGSRRRGHPQKSHVLHATGKSHPKWNGWTVRTSADGDFLVPDSWNQAIVTAVNRRRSQQSGRTKGRVVGVFDGDALLGVLTYHLAQGAPIQLRVFEVCPLLSVPDGIMVKAFMLELAWSIVSIAPGRKDCLDWVISDSPSQRDMADYLNFRHVGLVPGEKGRLLMRQMKP